VSMDVVAFKEEQRKMWSVGDFPSIAHTIEDASLVLLEAIDVRLGRPGADPHGDLIPARDGSLVRVPAILLADAVPGHAGTVLRISDRDPAVLRDLAADAIGPGSALTVLESCAVRLPGGRIRPLGPDAAASIWLTK